jgi:hypothetical protein
MSIIATRQSGSVVTVSVLTGGSGYASPPTVAVIGGGGTGAAAVAHMAGTAVESVVLTAGGTGYTGSPQIQFSGGSGSGAAATAFAYTGPLRPTCFFKGRGNDMYGVDGMGRGLRWTGDSATVEVIGISKPATAPAVTASSSAGNRYVSAVQLVNAGAGYNNVPSVVFSGGTPGRDAVAKATLTNGRVTRVDVTDGGAGYQDTPTVTLSGGLAGGATLSVGVVGQVDSLSIASQGTGYTAAPDLVFSTAQGLTRAAASVTVAGGKVTALRLLSAGTGATTSGVTAMLVGGGTGAQVSVDMVYRVSALTVSAGGTGYRSAPVITFRAAPEDPVGGGAAATAVISGGSLTAATVYAGGQYSAIPSAFVIDSTAKATATLTAPMSGTYKCCIRYLDSTPESRGGPIPSSISDLEEVDIPNGSGSLTWAFTHSGLEDRVTAMELWRTTADQSVVLFRVATIQRSSPSFFGSYTDTLSDDDLRDTDREQYGLMPVTLPNGQINARRFQAPPGNYGVATMFQDRAWYAVDTSGDRPNSLLYSEVDEPESVPESNELVLQESVADPDAIVALVPLGSLLAVCQSRHLYRLQYVAQPVLDASITLVAYRGILSQNCWDVLGGIAYIVDSYGLYAFDGQQAEPVSIPVDNYWRERVINFQASAAFHVRADHGAQVIRFFYCRTGESLPTRALCYCIATKTWWEEVFATAVTASTEGVIAGRQDTLWGTGSGAFAYSGGYTDLQGTPIPYEFRTGNMPLGEAQTDGGSRSIGVLYSPTVNSSQMQVRLHYNNSPSPRPAAISTDRGGFASAAGSTAAVLDLRSARSSLGPSNGFAKAYFSGHRDERSVGGDRHVAVAVAGTQASTVAGDVVRLYGLTIEGVS